MAKTTIVNIKDLGLNCWKPGRFIRSERCPKVIDCAYPEKKTCEAVIAEITYLREERDKREAAYRENISRLIKERGE